MIKQPSTTICNELKKSYRGVDLEWLFWELTGSETNGVFREPFERALLEIADTSRVENEYGHLDLKTYRVEIYQSIGDFVDNCIRYGVLRETAYNLLLMELVDPTLMISERDGFKVEFNRTHPRTVYRKRMNTSGRIDIKANGDPAIEGVTAKSALSW